MFLLKTSMNKVVFSRDNLVITSSDPSLSFIVNELSLEVRWVKQVKIFLFAPNGNTLKIYEVREAVILLNLYF